MGPAHGWQPCAPSVSPTNIKRRVEGGRTAESRGTKGGKGDAGREKKADSARAKGSRREERENERQRQAGRGREGPHAAPPASTTCFLSTPTGFPDQPACSVVAGCPVGKEPSPPLLWTPLPCQGAPQRPSLFTIPGSNRWLDPPRAPEAHGLPLCSKPLVKMPESACCFHVFLLSLDFKTLKDRR